MAKRKALSELVRADASDVPSRRNRINFFELGPAHRRPPGQLRIEPGRFLTCRNCRR